MSDNITGAKHLYLDYIEERQRETYRVLEASFILSREQICEALKHDSILVNGVEYYTPYNELIECLKHKRFGTIQLKLREVKKK